MAILTMDPRTFLVHGAALVSAFLFYDVPHYTQLVFYLSPSSKNDYYPFPIFGAAFGGYSSSQSWSFHLALQTPFGYDIIT
jgi:hypothetical protein